MSKERELLLKAVSYLHDTYDGVKYMENLLEEIDNYLSEPEAEPVVWWDGDASTNGECMTEALRKLHIEKGSTTYKDYPIPLYIN